MSTSIPEKETGKNIDLTDELELPDAAAAASLFKLCRERLLSPGNWKELSGDTGADFQLFSAEGEKLKRPAELDDRIRIEIPGPSSPNHEYDWVRIAKLESDEAGKETDQQLLLELRPTASPENRDNKTAHFFKDKASSSFTLSRKQKKVLISYHGRNEELNNATGKIGENIRNTAVGLGALAGLSELQWTALLKGILGKE